MKLNFTYEKVFHQLIKLSFIGSENNIKIGDNYYKINLLFLNIKHSKIVL